MNTKNIEDFYPLSPMQQGMWFHSLYAPGSGVYFEQLCCTMHGDLHVSAFARAWQRVVDRHPILRTAFIGETLKEPVQVVQRQAQLPVEQQDWRRLSAVEQEARLEAFLQADRRCGFRLSEAPLMRLAIMRLADDAYRFVWSYHHLLLDGWSVPILLQEVFAFYEAFCCAQDLHLEACRPYRDYIVWLKRQDLAAAEAFWRPLLRGMTAPTPLVVDRVPGRVSAQPESYAAQETRLSAATTAALHALARQQQVTLSTLVQGAWAVLLSRYSGEDDVVFGSTVSGRPAALAGAEAMVGLFINTLPVRLRITPETALLAWLKELQGQLVEMRQYEHSPLAQVQGWSALPRGVPLFESLVVFENYPVQTALLQQQGGLHIRNVHAVEQTNYPLTVVVGPAPELLLRLAYDGHRFDTATICRMLGHLQTLLEGMAANPHQRLADLPLLTDAERQQMLRTEHTAYVASPMGACLHHLFAAQVERSPDTIAAVYEDEQLTYWELNVRANQLAHHLRTLGVGPEVLVGLYMERSLAMVIGLLGILKAGGTYVPLEPAYPPARLAFMLEDTQAPVLVTQQQLLEGLPTHEVSVLCLDRDWRTIAQAGETNPSSGTMADSLAYVIYTSGSTGQPKGVGVSHANVVRLFDATQPWYHFDARDAWTLFHSLAFDFSVWELWGALLHGGRLVVVPYWVSRAPEVFYELLGRERVTVLNQTPSAFRQLIRAEETAAATGDLALRLVIFGGEALDLQSLQPWFVGHGDRSPQLVNMYGITETTVHVTYRPLAMTDCTLALGSVIGEAIPDLQIYVLDPYLHPVPIGVPGELFVGGAGVARGYLQRPELSAERFIPNPFGTGPGARLYKTGDLVRYRADGELEYLGRIDQQVKIRGFRIELGEIEAVLEQHPAVREAVVLAREDHPNDKRLVAYLVTTQHAVPSSSELRDLVKTKLPDYMVPAAFVLLEALPLTPNGKVDRRALPAPAGVRPDLAVDFVLPRTPIEKILAGIWSQVLSVPQIGVHDNFFELGGDSILSIQVVGRANREGLRLTPKQIFQHPSIAELATVVDIAPATQAEQGLVTGWLPLTPIQHWFFEHPLAVPQHFNQAVLLEVQQALDASLLERVVQYLLQHHDALRLRFVPGASGWQQSNAALDEAGPFMRVDLSLVPDQEQRPAMEASVAALQASLHLSQGPLMRVALFDLGAPKPGRLLIIIHHLAVDGVSWRILLEDLQTGYQQLSHGEAIALPAKTTSFQHWARRLLTHAQSTAVQQELAYWLDPARTRVVRLPVDHPQKQWANTVASSRTVSVTLSPAETWSLLHEVPEVYHTQINDVLLTALVQVFAQWTGVRALLVDLEGHGREPLFDEVDLSRTVGWFTSCFPVLLDLEKVVQPGDALKAVKEQLRAVPNRGISYGLLRYLHSDERLSEQVRSLPQAEVSFNYLGQLDQVLSGSLPFRFARESCGLGQSPQESRRHLLNVSGSVSEDRLQLVWIYSENVHRRSTIERLAYGYLQALRTLITHCQSPEAGGYTPSDFPLAGLEQSRLESLVGNDRDLEDIYPLSPMQEGMLFHSLYAPESGVYITQVTCTLGSLHVTALQDAWQRVVERHPILRTAFIWKGLDRPLQVVRRRVRLPLAQCDWRGLSPSEQTERLQAYLDTDRRRGFELSTAPLMRVALLRIAEDTHQLVWTNHHLLLDGWSTSLLLKEILAFYAAFCGGQDLRLTPSRPYRDYIAWLQQQDLARAEAFWRQFLKGFQAPTLLGAVGRGNEEAPSLAQSDGIRQSVLSVATTSALQALTRQHGLTMNTLVQGVWALLLSRYSGKDDVVFGTTVAGRPADLSGVEAMIGLFINTLPIRVHLALAARLFPWLQALQDQQVELRQYEYSPLTQVQGWSDVPQDVPLFQSIVVFENYPAEAVQTVQGPNQSLQVLHVDSSIRNSLPFTVRAVPGPQLLLQILYDSGRFDAATVDWILG
ncbi:MAG TPA: amino acid adenylation domain-containing protein, partial [Candidatus Tectomicrobia bacterium]